MMDLPGGEGGPAFTPFHWRDCLGVCMQTLRGRTKIVLGMSLEPHIAPWGGRSGWSCRMLTSSPCHALSLLLGAEARAPEMESCPRTSPSNTADCALSGEAGRGATEPSVLLQVLPGPG